MQFQRHSVFGQAREQAFLPPNRRKPSAGASIRLTVEPVQHAETQMQPAWAPFAEAMPVQPVRHFAPVAALAEVPEAVHLVRVRFAPLATKQAEDNRALPTPTSTPMPTLPLVQEQHKPEERLTLIRGEEYASVVPIRGANH